ncbi:MAG TPA: bifunctional riboflavin kinase/FAD synthetase [Thermoanaerobaculia bacterium]|nr:bifunctional riboflavin kinase/FAD synthetase [Thermoanaerobaculia bacterium]
MQVVQDALRAADLPSGTIVTIGNYDGIHRGQQEVLRRVVERAGETGLHSVVVTFEPHPLEILRPESAPPRIVTLAQKEALLAELGVDHVLVVRFTHEFAQTPARSFVRDFLHEKLGAREIYVGADFSFGHRREGDVTLLRQMGETYGFATFAVDEVRAGSERISSTRIRELLRQGEVVGARELLGRPYSITGIVARGDRMGKRLGWPTINLSCDHLLVAVDGVFASRVYFPSFPATFDSVTNIGTRPTVYENYERVVESHILDFRSDVYGEAVELQFWKRLRDEKMFPSIMDLSAQIGRDVEEARGFFAALRAREEIGAGVVEGGR